MKATSWALDGHHIAAHGQHAMHGYETIHARMRRSCAVIERVLKEMLLLLL